MEFGFRCGTKHIGLLVLHKDYSNIHQISMKMPSTITTTPKAMRYSTLLPPD